MTDVMKIMPAEKKYIEFICSHQTTRLLYSGILVNMDFVVSFDRNICIIQNKKHLPVK